MKPLQLALVLLPILATAADAPPLGTVTAIAAERQVALVIGNASYRESPLTNPVNDAKDVATKLRSLGFDVVERTDLSSRQIGSALREFRSKLVPGAVALVFYAGHGLQVRGENYLPMVDAHITDEEDVPNQSLSVRQLLELLDQSKTRLNLLFLDACRNNPFVRRFRDAGGGGLARVNAPSGTLMSFATRPGSLASDGTGRNGLYTSHLLRHMGQSRDPVEIMLKRVVSGVKASSQGRQEPWMEGSIEGDFCFGGCAVASAAMPIATSSVSPGSVGSSPAWGAPTPAEAESRVAESGPLGLIVTDIADPRGVGTRGGARVVSAEGAAARGGLVEGDVIIDFSSQKISSSKQLMMLARRAEKEKKPIALLVRRGNHESYVVIRP